MVSPPHFDLQSDPGLTVDAVQVSDVPTRRALLAGAAALVALVPAHSALAASRQQLFAAYYDNTEEILDATQRVLDIDPSDDGYTSKVPAARCLSEVAFQPVKYQHPTGTSRKFCWTLPTAHLCSNVAGNLYLINEDFQAISICDYH